MPSTSREPWTAEELDRLPEGWRYEIDEGELVIMAPAGWLHGKVTSRVTVVLGRFVYERHLGEVVADDLDAGVRAVWVVDPQARTLTRHAPGEAPRMWSGPEALIEEPVLPGLSCRLGELFGEGRA